MFRRSAHTGLATIVGAIIITGFLITSLMSYFVSVSSVKKAILTNELPLSSDNIYSEIQRDLLNPVLVSSFMASDTFLRDWILEGEVDKELIRQYLKEIKNRYNTVTSFFVSERTGNYYYADGILKTVKEDEPRDAWYFRVRSMTEEYETNVDPDMANHDAMTLFINYRVLDYEGNFLGATGVGLTLNTAKTLIAKYQKQFGRTVYLTNHLGTLLLYGEDYAGPLRLADRNALAPHLDTVLKKGSGSVEFKENNRTVLLNSRFLPELNWILVVEQPEGDLLEEFEQTLKGSLLICGVVTLFIVSLNWRTVRRYQQELEQMALADGLTGVANRRCFTIRFGQILSQYRREPEPVAFLLMDIDRFKSVNDRFGHLTGDRVLKMLAQVIQGRIRSSDILCRWGGEEFLVVLRKADMEAAQGVAEEIRQAVESSRLPDEDALAITISIGVAALQVDDDERTVVVRADEALYRAKAEGRNRVVIAR